MEFRPQPTRNRNSQENQSLRNDGRCRTKKRRLAIITAVIIVALPLIFLYLYIDPASEEYGRWFPKCLVHTLTGLSCPSCGAQRAFHALLSGNPLEALRQNWFLLFSGLYLCGLGVSRLYWNKIPKVGQFFWGRTGGLIYVGVYIGWFIVRNILGV